MSDRMKWDSRADRRLRKLFDANCTYREMAQIFGCSESAVAGRVHRLGMPLRNTTNRSRKHPNYSKPKSLAESIFLNGEPLKFAETGPNCARCGVRQDAHPEQGCGQFASELRVRT